VSEAHEGRSIHSGIAARTAWTAHRVTGRMIRLRKRDVKCGARPDRRHGPPPGTRPWWARTVGLRNPVFRLWRRSGAGRKKTSGL